MLVEFPDDGIQEGVLRSHMAPADRHLGPRTWSDFTGVSGYTRAMLPFQSPSRSRAHDAHCALRMETQQRRAQRAVIRGPKFPRTSNRRDKQHVVDLPGSEVNGVARKRRRTVTRGRAEPFPASCFQIERSKGVVVGGLSVSVRPLERLPPVR